MTTYRVTVDPTLCSGFGACLDVSKLFRLDPGGVASATVEETDDAGVIDAAAACPMAAIAVERAA
jgi:ferredoxin